MVKYLDSQSDYTLVFALNAKDELVPSLSFPVNGKKKACYFLKKQRGPVLDMQQMNEKFEAGDAPTVPLDTLQVLLDEIYLPLLSTPSNLGYLPVVVSSDFLKGFQNLSGSVSGMQGKAKGKTVLPVPELSKGSANVGLYEKSVITWTHIIQALVKKQASTNDESSQGPNVETAFWKSRAADLRGVQEQLSGPTISKMADAMQGVKSAYY